MAVSESKVGGYSYDVFLSFRGSDTRLSFTANLYKALKERGMKTFFDPKLMKGEETPASLEEAIKHSRISIVVFSENYASSKFCLDELVRIMENHRMVLPVFYHVDPSHVLNQEGIALAMQEKSNSESNKVVKWRNALREAAELPGWAFKYGDGYEYELIEKIVDSVSKKIKLPVADHLVGLQRRVLEIKSLLSTESLEGEHLVGIWGMGGIGKTTIARALYDSVAVQFDATCFLGEVRQNAMKHGIVHLQKTLLAEILREKDIQLPNVSEGISIIKQRLCKKKVLLVLDDIWEFDQLQKLVGSPDSFGPGSRIILTTRDKQLLRTNRVEKIYEVEKLSKVEAIELLCWKAFKTNRVDPNFIDKIYRAINHASGIPLALEVIGSNLFGRGIKEWEYTLDLYEKMHDKDIQKVLKISFDALDQLEKEVFLDIACYFNGFELAEIEKILSAAHDGYCLKPQIGALVEKSLIKINDYSRVIVHELIQDLGREIVRQESLAHPLKPSRLHSAKDIVHVSKENTSSRKELATDIEALKKKKITGTE